jgi:TatD DNase family protein
MELVDTHCHIQSVGLSGNGDEATLRLWAKAGELTPDAVVGAAREAGVTRLLCVGCDPADSRLAIDFAANRPDCWATTGIHPHEAKRYAGDASGLAAFAALAGEDKVVAVGECGLDYFYEHSPRADQLAVLRFQFELALERNLPMIFHVREALDDFWPVFDEYNSPSRPVRGVLHSFTDSMINLDKALGRGLYIGVNGIATFAKDPAQLEVYRRVPLQRLLLETDAPFLTPVPYRGNINEPKYIREIADFIAQLRGDRPAQLASTTTTNACQLFGL